MRGLAVTATPADQTDRPPRPTFGAVDCTIRGLRAVVGVRKILDKR